MIYFWGANRKVELFENVYNTYLYDSNDPEIFLAHGTDDQTVDTPFSEAEKIRDLCNTNGIYNELVPLQGEDHGAWGAEVNGKSLFEMSFDFITQRQNLNIQ